VIQRPLNVNEDNDAYLAEEASHGKASEDLRKLEIEHTDPIARAMAKYNLDQNEVDLYVMAKHAEERNADIDKINPEMNGAGSGMSNAQAQSILDKAVVEEKYQALENIASRIYAMQKFTNDIRIKHGLTSKEEIASWNNKYKYYVPLKGYAVDEGTHATDDKGNQTTRYAKGKGLNIRGRETMKAMGRRSIAESPLAHSVMAAQEAIKRAHKNEVGNTFLKLVNDNPDSDLWEVFTEQKLDTKRGSVTKNGKTTIEMVKIPALAMQQSDDYFKTKVEGVEHYIKLKDTVLKDTMANFGPKELGTVINKIGEATRFLSALNTTWNPEFILTNVARDIQTAVGNMLAETQVSDGKALDTEKLTSKMVTSMPKAAAVLRQGFRDNKFDGSGKFSDPKWGNYLKEFLESGAKTGWAHQKDIKDITNDFKGAIARAGNTKSGKAQRYFKGLANFVGDYNDVVENSARFSAYYHAREQGISVKKASSLAKNLTINFNRKGELGPLMNSLFMFANAAVQGHANVLRALAKTKDSSKSALDVTNWNTTQKLAIGLVFSTIAANQIMREIGGDDDDGVPLFDKIPAHVKATNFVIMTGGKDENGKVNYTAIPMPYGYNLLGNIGHAIDGVIQGKSVGKQGVNLALSIIGGISPIGVQQSDSVIGGTLKTILPTVAKPIAELGLNENFFGSNITLRKLGYSTPKSDAFAGGKHTWDWLKDLTEFASEKTGGTKYRGGTINVSPQQVEHILKFIGGGAGAFWLRTFNFGDKLSNDKEIQPRDIPFIRRFYKQLDPKQTIYDFYDTKKGLDKYRADLDGMRGKPRVKYLSDYKNQLLLGRYANGIDKQLRALNKAKRNIEASSLPQEEKDRKLEIIDNRKIDATMKFSKKRYDLGLKNL